MLGLLTKEKVYRPKEWPRICQYIQELEDYTWDWILRILDKAHQIFKSRRKNKQFLFIWGEPLCTFMVLPCENIKSPALCIWGWDHLDIPENITLVHHIYDTTLIRLEEQEVMLLLQRRAEKPIRVLPY